MKKRETPPEKKRRQKIADPENIDGQNPPDETGSAGKTPEQDKEENEGKPSEAELISHWRDPVTNQAEQEKITNAEGDDIPLANT